VFKVKSFVDVQFFSRPVLILPHGQRQSLRQLSGIEWADRLGQLLPDFADSGHVAAHVL